MKESKFRAAFVLSIITIILGIIASAGGLLIKDLYQDNELVKSTWLGNDIVTLVLVIPVMIVSVILSTRGSKKAQLVWIGTLWYMTYNYVFYLFGSYFNSFFLLYVALFTVPAYALIFALSNMDVTGIAKTFRSQTPVKWISTFMILFSVMLGIVWVALSARYIFTGEVPPHIIQTETITCVVFATDLSMALPLMIWSGLLLWQRKPWGFVLGAMVLFKAVTYGLVLSVNSWLGYYLLGLGDSLAPVWVALTLGGLLAWVAMLRNMGSSSMRLRGSKTYSK